MRTSKTVLLAAALGLAAFLPARADASAQPNVFSRMAGSARNMLIRTGDFLNPFNNNNKTPPKPPSATGTRRVYRVSEAETQRPMFANWFGRSEPEVERPLTVSDFLDLPRPQ